MAAVVALQGCLKPRSSERDSTDILGLTAEDYRYDPVDVEVLRRNAEAAAESAVSQQGEAFLKGGGGSYTVAIDYSAVPFLREKGYRSSFYYYCWDIYLPYRFQTESGESHLLVVQVSDKTPGNTHDISKFRVVRTVMVEGFGKGEKGLE